MAEDLHHYYWATFSHSESGNVAFSTAYSGKTVKVFVAKHDGTNVLIKPLTITSEGYYIVPSGVGVLVCLQYGESGAPGAIAVPYTSTATIATEADFTSNLLMPSVDVQVGPEEGYRFFKLAYGPKVEGFYDISTLGFYYYIDGGTYIPAVGSGQTRVGKAYLKSPESLVTAAPGRFLLEEMEEDNATSVEIIESAEKVVKFIENGQLRFRHNGIVYDITGRIITKE